MRSRSWPAVSSRALADGAVLSGYALVAFLCLGVPLLAKSGNQYLGSGTDPAIPIWAFGWFVHAILHGENPFFTHVIWAPEGANVTWTTVVPGLALAFAPLTLAVGAIDSYTVAMTLMPAFAAWTAYLLCRYLTRSLWPSVVGGFLFGFSSYLLSHDEFGHPQLSSVLLLPLAALLVLRFLDRRLSGRRLIVEVGLVLAFQVLLSTEVTFTLTLAAIVALPLAFLLVPDRRLQIRALVPYLIGAYALAGVLTAPFLYYALTGFHHAFLISNGPGTDLLNFVVPTPSTLPFGGWLSGVSARFPGNPSEKDGYLGLPTLVVMALFAKDRFRTPSGRFLLAAVVVVFVAALGAKGAVAGRLVLNLPWMLVHNLPFFDNVLTGRLTAYLTLLAAVIVALWTAARRPGLLRWLLPLLAVLAIVPDPRANGFAHTYGISPFFSGSAYRGCLRPNETLLLIPQPEQVVDQAVDGFRFNLAGGYIGPGAIPQSYLEPPSRYSIAIGSAIPPDQIGALRSFIASKHVTSIVVEDYDYEHFAPTFNRLAEPHHVGGVVLYHVSGPAPPCPP